MAIQKRNIIRAVILFVFALSAFGFRFAPDYSEIPPQVNSDPSFDGWIEITIQMEAEMYEGNTTHELYWFPETVILPITHDPTSKKWIVHGESAYTVYRGEGSYAGGLGTVLIFQVANWEISAILYPDCSVEFFLDLEHYPGTSLACIDNIGCMTDSVQGVSFPNRDISLKMPGDETMVELSVMIDSQTKASLLIFKESMTAGDTCQEARYLP